MPQRHATNEELSQCILTNAFMDKIEHLLQGIIGSITENTKQKAHDSCNKICVQTPKSNAFLLKQVSEELVCKGRD